MHRTNAVGLAALSVGVACGCAPGRDTSPPATIRDSSGVHIVEGRFARPTTRWRLGPPQVEIGVAEGDDRYQLYRVTGAVRLDDGSIVVANAGTKQLRWYDGEGRFVRQVGREGGGPGEFVGMNHLARYGGDSLLIWDGRQRRVSVFDDAGGFARSVTLPVSGTVNGVFEDGAVLFQRFSAGGEGHIRNDEAVVRATLDGVTVDTLGMFPGREVVMETRRTSSNMMVRVAAVPFGRRAYVVGRSGGFVVGTQDRYELLDFDVTGNLRAVLRLAHDPRPVTSDDLAAYREEQLVRLEPDDRPARRRELDDMPYPETMPAHGALHADGAGNLWVQEYRRYADTADTWIVYDPDLLPSATIVTPTAHRLVQIGADFVLAVRTDEFDIEHVTLYPLHKQ